jgi:hypothetical protein
MNKFEQLLDFIVNEEKAKAEELFHAIVVEKSRDIYEQLIAEETKEEEEDDEEEMDEAKADDSEDEESVEEAFGMDDEETGFPGGDSADGIPDETEAPTAHDDEADGEEGGDDTSPATKGDVQDLEDALEDLKAEFERLMSGDEGDDEEGGEEAPEFGAEDDEEDDEEQDEEEDESAMPFEGRQVTREYRETIGKPYGSGNGISNKNEAGDGKAGPVNQNPKDRPTTGATARNIAQGGNGTEGIKGGEGLVGGVKGEFTKGVEKNISSSSKSSMKSGSETSKNPAGHGAEKKGSGESASNTRSIVDRKIG